MSCKDCWRTSALLPVAYCSQKWTVWTYIYVYVDIYNIPDQRDTACSLVAMHANAKLATHHRGMDAHLCQLILSIKAQQEASLLADTGALLPAAHQRQGGGATTAYAHAGVCGHSQGRHQLCHSNLPPAVGALVHTCLPYPLQLW